MTKRLLEILSRWDAFVFAPIRAERWIAFRFCFTLTYLYYQTDRFSAAREWLTEEGFHLNAATQFWYLPEPLPLMPPWMIPVFFLLVYLPGLLLLAGFWPRICSFILFLTAVYAQGVDQISAFTLNKFYIVFFLLMALAPGQAPGGFSGLLRSAWPIRVVQITLLIQYFTAGWCKIAHGPWLEDPDVLYTQVQGLYVTDMGAWMLRVLPPEAWSLLMYNALVFELFAPILFCMRRFVLPAMIWGGGFHLVIALTMKELIFFSLQMVSFYILFTPDEPIRRAMETVHRFRKRLDALIFEYEDEDEATHKP